MEILFLSHYLIICKSIESNEIVTFIWTFIRFIEILRAIGSDIFLKVGAFI